MTEVNVLFGTESGNAEMVADEIAEVMTTAGLGAVVTELTDVDIPDLGSGDVVVLISSTYGEGGLSASAEPFYEALADDRPALDGLRFAAFGLGDSSYENYNRAIDTLSALLVELGAEQIGMTGRHDATSGTSPVDVAVDWANELVADLQPSINV
ncbi:nitric oxide synthase [Aeromicrobium sp. Root236]|uniref:flavodoxin domain-containing protein n=1 Tax=Aeromicrobium sp. Root236 TaxID=1736498 RepID=UPI0006F1F01F|nr:flavodoxin family protein [Aeromicrobium sp. Root236]KRC67028.1 nitric oxide synthase [Aeromicrobium sp. Root236]